MQICKYFLSFFTQLFFSVLFLPALGAVCLPDRPLFTDPMPKSLKEKYALYFFVNLIQFVSNDSHSFSGMWQSVLPVLVRDGSVKENSMVIRLQASTSMHRTSCRS